jgi:CDP-diacylglycerol---serine O-phosphatidyltransferase
MNITKHIPNIITLINLFCGCIAVVFIANCQFEYALFFVGLGIFFDFFDGFFARLFKVSSPLGLQLDSLADMVTSGVAPGFVMYQIFQGLEYDPSLVSIYSFIGFVITLGACYRLANFNIDERQTDSFIGLPTPANALFILSLPLIIKENTLESVTFLLTNKWVLTCICLVSAYIMNAEIPLFSLKIKNFDIKKNSLQIGFLLFSIVVILLLKFYAIPLIIIVYIILSVVNNIFSKK